MLRSFVNAAATTKTTTTSVSATASSWWRAAAVSSSSSSSSSMSSLLPRRALSDVPSVLGTGEPSWKVAYPAAGWPHNVAEFDKLWRESEAYNGRFKHLASWQPDFAKIRKAAPWMPAEFWDEVERDHAAYDLAAVSEFLDKEKEGVDAQLQQYREEILSQILARWKEMQPHLQALEQEVAELEVERDSILDQTPDSVVQKFPEWGARIDDDVVNDRWIDGINEAQAESLGGLLAEGESASGKKDE